MWSWVTSTDPRLTHSEIGNTIIKININLKTPLLTWKDHLWLEITNINLERPCNVSKLIDLEKVIVNLNRGRLGSADFTP